MMGRSKDENTLSKVVVSVVQARAATVRHLTYMGSISMHLYANAAVAPL